MLTHGYAGGQWGRVETTSGADGTFTLKSSLPAGATMIPLTAGKEGLAIGWENARPGVPARLQLAANPITLRGIVRDEGGKALAGAEIMFQYARVGEGPPRGGLWLGEDQVKRSDAEGRFSFEGLPTGCTVTAQVTAPGLATVLAELKGTEETVIVLQPEATISGRVLQGDKPLAKVSVNGQTMGPGGQGTGTVTGEDGTYTLPHLPEGGVHLFVNPPPGLAWPPTRVVELKPGEHVTGIDFVLTPGGVVRGRVTEAGTDKPIAMATVGGRGGENEYSGWTQSKADGKY